MCSIAFHILLLIYIDDDDDETVLGNLLFIYQKFRKFELNVKFYEIVMLIVGFCFILPSIIVYSILHVSVLGNINLIKRKFNKFKMSPRCSYSPHFLYSF